MKFASYCQQSPCVHKNIVRFFMILSGCCGLASSLSFCLTLSYFANLGPNVAIPYVARMHIALKRQGMPGGFEDLCKSMSSSLGGNWNNSMFGGAGGMGYCPIKF
jgi:hypothetical protein